MNDSGHWPHTRSLLQAAAVRRGGTAYVRGDGIVLSPGETGQGVSIRIEDHGDDGALIQAGQIIKVLADCEDDGNEPVHAVELVEGIMDGRATETAHVLGDELVALSWTITSPHGGGSWGEPTLPEGTRAYSRRLPAWSM